jgi:hypothetical protein
MHPLGGEAPSFFPLGGLSVWGVAYGVAMSRTAVRPGGTEHGDIQPAPGRWPHRAMLLVFSGTLFVSSALLFLMEPMFAKMVQPLLGSVPAVWNTSVLFIQATLLAGYA